MVSRLTIIMPDHIHPLLVSLLTAAAGGAGLCLLHRYRTAHNCGTDTREPEAAAALRTGRSASQGSHDSARALREHLEKYSLEHDAAKPFADSPQTTTFEDLDIEPMPQAARYKAARRTTVSGPSTNLAETRSYRPVGYPKTADEEANLRKSLRTCQLFSQLDDDELGLVVGAMSRVEFVQGSNITLQDEAMDPDMERFMVIASGEVSVIKDGTVLRVLRPWQYLNERHLMFVHSNCKLTHRVDTPRCTCFALSADDYRHIVTRVAIDKSELYEGFLDRVTWLKGLTHREKMQLADCLQPVIYNDGDYLIEYDTVGVWLYVIVEGTVEVYGRKNGEIVKVCEFGQGDCVGELEFLNNHRTVADVRAKGRVKAARLHRDHFELCMGPIVDVLRRSSVADERFAYYRALIDHDRTSSSA
jgi:CRP-like cAMP-binding protein